MPEGTRGNESEGEDMKMTITVEHEIDVCDDPNCDYNGTYECIMCGLMACRQHTKGWIRDHNPAYVNMCLPCYNLGKKYRAIKKKNDAETANALNDWRALCEQKA